MKTIKSTFIWLILAVIFLAGCNYYRVTDPATSRVYYTRDVQKLSGGAIRIKDEKSGNEVTLQNSEVQKIEKEEFNQGVYAK